MKQILKLSLFAICILTAALSSCKKDEAESPVYYNESDDFFPLKIGNKWFYPFKTTEVKGMKTINNKEYFEIATTYQLSQNPSPFIEYYRKTDDGKVYTMNNFTENEYVIYDFNIPEDHSWIYNDGDSEWKVTNTASYETFVLNSTRADNCRQFDYDLIEAVDDEHLIVLAPGIGKVITKSYAWALGDTIQSAIISGKEYTFQ